ncbi:hypothetical protein MMC13_007192 [Lambiella insularis]|nr:hypothetical protein [Lambiella insularis]
MKLTLQDRLLHRELGEYSPNYSVKGLYGDRKWVHDLDIVNELGGHSGCVNALSWSKSGRLLASGSDDRYLNIYSYQPDVSTTPFALMTTVATGHTANIFSVKFMPHSNDQTLVTCAGDGEVRIFDIEYSGHFHPPSAASNKASMSRVSRKINNVFHGVRYLSDGDTNARVYRSHSDRVKRIVTESSPFLFLSCSEDGDVRQWDLRLPSSAYPSPRNRRDKSDIPPPLISYKRYQLDLNTISCSATQPHYIVLGGNHLHCFLHDRRMLGRDVKSETGSPGNTIPASELSEHEDDLMGEATRCVRRFAPSGQKKMSKTDNGHVTACKISDVNPNEMIASWSGNHIYSFDLVNSSDVREIRAADEEDEKTTNIRRRVKESKRRNAKRRHANSSKPADGRIRGQPQPTQESDISLRRIRYENGQSEEISIERAPSYAGQALVDEAHDSRLTEAQKRSLRIAKSVMKMKKLMFSLDASTLATQDNASEGLMRQVPLLTSVLGFAAGCLPEMDEIIRGWRYPVEPSETDVAFQKTLRLNRDSGRRFVQVAGALARVLGGRLKTEKSSVLQQLQEVKPSPNEALCEDAGQIFSYNFLKAILLWLEGGLQALLQGFKKPPDQRNDNGRFPIPLEAELSGIDDYLIPYLLRQARPRTIPNVDASHFEKDEYRQTFPSEATAVIAFSHAIRTPLQNLPKAVMPTTPSASSEAASTAGVAVQDRNSAFKYWGFQVGRGVLMNAGESVHFALVDLAFGGLGLSKGQDEGRAQDDIIPTKIDQPMHGFDMVHQPEMDGGFAPFGDTRRDQQGNTGGVMQVTVPNTSTSTCQETIDRAHSEPVIPMQNLHDKIADDVADDRTTSQESDEGNESNDIDSEGLGDSDSDGDITTEERHSMWQGASDRGKLREAVHACVPCTSHTRTYRGHCNVKTVKDVNFFGLQDEYVVSGSDSGHLFIWDKKTSQLLNILEGDEEVVNVMQGHPYEPLLAVSGIDHTIKIFSPDRQSQEDARNGVNLGISATRSTGHSSLFIRSPRLDRPIPISTDADGETTTDPPNGSEAPLSLSGHRTIDSDQKTKSRKNGGLASRKRMQDSYQIVSQNDVERQGGMRDAFITVCSPLPIATLPMQFAT